MNASSRIPEPIPDNFESVDDLDAFWSTHSLADYDAEMDEIVIDVRLSAQAKPHEAVTLAPELAARLRNRARDQGVSVSELLDRIVAEALPK